MAPRLTTTQWLICVIAAIGFAFDIYELLMLPLIIKPAIAALSAPIIDELVRGGMPRPDAMALWVPGGDGTSSGPARCSSCPRSQAACSACWAGI